MSERDVFYCLLSSVDENIWSNCLNLIIQILKDVFPVENMSAFNLMRLLIILILCEEAWLCIKYV